MSNSPPMTVIDEQGRTEPPFQASEFDTLAGFLDFQRATLQWKAAGIDSDGLRATLHPTTMTLGGILKHMAWVEDYWFGVRMAGNAPSAHWVDVDWEADGDWEWNSAASDSPEQLRDLWSAEVNKSRQIVADVMAGGGLEQPMANAFKDGRTPTLRWILVHMIEEYARHNGHADLLRESVDGQTGE